MWGDLSASEKAELMRIFINSGIRDLSTMRNIYEEEFKGGGDIHIKPSHRGRFTSLLRRTGKSASWYKAHGTPAQRKMATFALNARKWHHGNGGYIEDDEEYFGGTLPAATKVAWLPEVQSPEGRAIASNMAERVASGKMSLGDVPRRYYNYVQGEAKGAIPMRGYMNKATNVALGTLAVPLATMAAAEAAPVLAPGSALWSNPITQQALASEIGGRAVDLISKDFTGKTWAENMSGAFDKATGLNSSDTFVGQSIAEMTNPGYLLSPSYFITKVGINRLPQAAFDSYANRLVKEGFTPSPSVATERPKLQQLPEVVKTTPKQELSPYEIEDLGGGYMLRSLMRGNPLEKQLSKQGTVNVNNVKALINKGSDIEKTIVDKVLSGNEFANKKTIDYNKFRKAVQDELITYDRTPRGMYAEYGLERLNLRRNGDSRNFDDFLRDSGYEARLNNGLVEYYNPETRDVMSYSDFQDYYKTVASTGANLNTFIFSSPRIPNGSAKHYDANTLGHSRTYTTANEPDVLHVMESQSDWAQSGVAQDIKGDFAQSNDLIETYQWRINQLEKEINTGTDQLGFSISEEAMADKRRILDDVKSWLEKELERNKELSSTNSSQAKYLSDNYTTKQIQENLRYAAERGQTKMRYPTRETAAKIEGYNKGHIYFDNSGNEVKDNLFTFGEEIDNEIASLQKEIKSIGDTIPIGNAEYLQNLEEYERFIDGQRRLLYEMEANPEDYVEGAIDKQLRNVQYHEERLNFMQDHPEEVEKLNNKYRELSDKIIDLKCENEIYLKPGITEKEVYMAGSDYKSAEAILRKYDAFPKQFKKLYKNADVRTVTDSKGNTWYEVDVPKDYLKKEWIYSTIPVGIGAGTTVNNDKNSYANGGPISGYNIFDILKIWNNSEDAQKNKIQSDSKILKKLANGIGGQEAVKDIGAVNSIKTFLSAPVGAIKGLLGKQNKYDDLDAYLYGPETIGMHEMTQTNGKDYSNYIDENFPTRDIRSYSGIINPYNEYIFAEEDRHAIDSIINSGGNFYSNADAEYKHYQKVTDNPDALRGTVEWKSMETPYRNDVGNYNMQIHKNKKGKYSISSSDLYDFSNNGKRQTIPQSLMGIVGNPYIIRQDNIPVRFIPLGDKINYKPMKYNDIDVNMDLTEEELRALNFHHILK